MRRSSGKPSSASQLTPPPVRVARGLKCSAVAHSSGLNLTFSGGRANRKGVTTLDDPWGFFVKPGWQLQLSRLGKTNFSGHFGQAEEFQALEDEFTSWGVAAVQNIDKVSTELFAFFRQYDLDRTGADFEPINLGGIGARVKS